MDRLAESMSEGVTMNDENLEVVLVNGAAQILKLSRTLWG